MIYLRYPVVPVYLAACLELAYSKHRMKFYPSLSILTTYATLSYLIPPLLLNLFLLVSISSSSVSPSPSTAVTAQPNTIHSAPSFPTLVFTISLATSTTSGQFSIWIRHFVLPSGRLSLVTDTRDRVNANVEASVSWMYSSRSVSKRVVVEVEECVDGDRDGDGDRKVVSRHRVRTK
jgi:hypothetical protein